MKIESESDNLRCLMTLGNALRSLANGWDSNSAAGRLRAKRFALLVELARFFEPPVRILDVGGQEQFWLAMDPGLLPEMELTLLNLHEGTSRVPNSRCVQGDARSMREFGDGAFDIVFSNSVIEHVGGLRDQKRMADECQRIGKAYLVQTPNRHFPLEPHFLLPFFQYLPLPVRAWLHASADIGWWKKAPGFFQAFEEVESIRLLTKAEMTYLFPRARIIEEKVAGLTKSFTAMGVSGSGTPPKVRP